MSIWATIGKSMAAEAGTQVGAGIGGVLGYGIGELFGHNRRARRQQLEQQNKLNALSFEWNKRQMNYAQDLEKQMYQYTFDMNKPEALKNLYKEAGLNPALMYGTSAGGVSGTSVGGGRGAGYNSQAANESEIIQSNLALQEMGLQMAKMRSEIDVNKSVANRNNADANLSGAKTKTEEQQRDALIAELYRRGELKWLETIRERLRLTGDTKDSDINYSMRIVGDKLQLYSPIKLPNDVKDSLFGKEVISAIEASQALKDNYIAETALANENLKNFYMQLMADIAVKDSQAALNKAKELESNWSTGEYMNWKNILESATNALNTILKLASMM